MSTVNEDLRGIILSTLPRISNDTLQALIDKLLNSGLESTQDLKYVTKEDIGDLLPVIQLRKLLEAFKKETEMVTLDLQILPSPTPAVSLPSDLPCSSASSELSNQESSSSEDCSPSAQIKKTWPDTFQIPWTAMPMDIRSAVTDGKRPSPAARRQMVRVLADEMRKYELNPTRGQCVTVCRNIIRQYPQSFADLRDNGQVLGNGYTSLLIQIKNRIENLNRTTSFRQHRSSGDGLKRGPTDTYGCTRFQPDLPPEETDATVEQKRQRLEEIYCRDGINGVERAEVKQLMETTFCLQRKQINILPAPTISDLRKQWPYLFTPKGLYAHFELLTDIKVMRALELAIEECGRAIVEFFSNKPTNADVRAVISLRPDLELSFCIIQLLMAHFSETQEGLILFANASSTAADVERTLELPATPRLILLGEKPGSCIHKWMISFEGQIICEGITPSFLSGLAAVFSTFYNFNVEYQAEAASTLEFIQRRFIGINPEKGTKGGQVLSKRTGKVAHKKKSVNTRVASLLKKLMDFEWDFI
ncbi:uncharacterized protein LOC125269950 [Megalobrama amblycephala]|uniref:uncharacterized protein LOC125255987 n=1 Tax=Megalobrama amblycephala TaxID=75352 RepID=UPI002013F736|nr:uncharacterized protein LOC125255987 [Megalobrama amblycephala]XP_048038765.1 uncharacterized protein LOC125263688 [Megalobrama amblycephala]XP_048038766.1 uncharacterized protein LOC125263688 [Megalobrama amblycephala]XP_048048856.1 uncharacterized protein LOC125269867 [Megalobrama amblycephala]XP_048049014.1 uncharacterized protein LOC125269950 [Megalobrama amblycephala]XP_048049015.1 uncharacterized protein LOC125269950 [Megalobrama amblycephala]XP_048049016.1 uncharacterized protein LO